MIPLAFMVPTGVPEPKYRPELSTRADLAPGKSPGLDVICDGILTGTPFVYPAERLSADRGAPHTTQLP
jgi:hypothetical protein